MTLKDPTPLSRNFSLTPEMQHVLARQCNHTPMQMGESHFDKERMSSMTDQDGFADLRLAHTLALVLKMTQEPTPITINNISASQSEATQQQLSMTEKSTPEAPRRPSLEIIGEMFNAFFSSNFNRFCFFGMCGVGAYMYWSYLDHKWHMEQVQRRIDSNFLLRTSQWLFNDSQLLNAPRAPSVSSSLPSPSKLLPSLW